MSSIDPMRAAPAFQCAMQLLLRLCAVVGAMALGASTSSAAEPKDVAARLDEFMQRQVERHQFSGTVLVARDGALLLAKGYGYANREWAVPNGPRTKFRLGSVTKQFTATVVMQLREQGLLDTADSVCKFIQPCPPAWKPVTLHHMMSNTSGISEYPATLAASRPGSFPWTAGNLAAVYRETPLEFSPGSKWKYSDTAYCVLGLVIEKVASKPYERVVRERIFEPLDMKDSGYDHPNEILEQRASGYRVVSGNFANAAWTGMATPFAAGGLYSTAEDLYRWDQALYGEAVLPRAALDLMWTEAARGYGYGYGWMISRATASVPRPPPWGLPGRFQLMHPGSINGFTAEILRFPEDRVTVIVLANLEDAPAIGPYLAAAVFDQSFSLPGR